MKITLLTGRTFDFEAALGFEIKVTRSPLARKLTLRIDTKDRLPALTIPKYCSNKKAVEFVRAHQSWIAETLEKLPPSRSFEDGEHITLFGKEYQICHQPDARSGEYTRSGILYVSGEADFLHRRVKDFIKKKAADEFYKRSCRMAEKLGCEVHDICIKDTKSRWGSCSSRNNINYNWRISLAPNFVINYLIAHEVAHLLHQDHSPEFWDTVKQLYPRYKQGRDWLKENGRLLYSYR